MKVAYFVRWDVSQETGVLKKVRDQLEAWLALGVEARLFALSPSPRIWDGLQSLPVDVEAGGTVGPWSRPLGRLLARIEDWQPDLAYLRFSTHYFPLEGFIARVPTVLELNTDDAIELRSTLPLYKYTYHHLMRDRILERARGMVAVTHELAEKFAEYGKPLSVIGNGIALEGHPAFPPAANPSVRAVFLGLHGAAWHGIDKIVWLAARLPAWRFDLIGVPAEGELPPNVHMHGVLRRAEYEGILRDADIAIGTLALHRKGMQEACPLKVREYLAAGLPCIIGYRDTDLEGPLPFVLALPNTEENVAGHVESILNFGERWKARRVERDAVRHLGTGAKEERRIAFFNEVVGVGETLGLTAAGPGRQGEQAARFGPRTVGARVSRGVKPR
jgi:glycosyltransferase involved in cell wall biosynthesis